MTLARRAFLRGRTLEHQALRPPGALAEADFIARCTRCNDCIEACPTGVIRRGAGGFPELSFGSGECTLCADCVAVCRPGALRVGADAVCLPYRASIADKCMTYQRVECRVCGEICASAAIAFRPQIGGVAVPKLDLDRCTGCGACEAPCPVGAISVRPTTENITCA